MIRLDATRAQSLRRELGNPRSLRAVFAVAAAGIAWLLMPTSLAQSTLAHDPGHVTSLVDEYSLETIGTSDRLPNSVARCLTQGPDGRLWIGTLDGLACFDGRAIRTFDLPDDQVERHAWIVSALLAEDGSLWFGGHRRVLRYDGHFQSFGPSDGIPDTTCEAIAQDATGALYFGFGDRLLRFQGERFEPMSLAGWLEHEEHGGVKVCADGSDALYLRTDTKLARRENDGFRTIEIERESPTTWCGFAGSKDGGIWVADATHVYRVRDDRVERRLEIPEKFSRAAVTLLEDSNGNLWLGSFYYGLVAFMADGRTLTAKVTDGLPHTHITSLFETATGEIFAGSGGAGLFQMRRRMVRHHLPLADNSAENSIVAVQAIGDSRVLATSLAGTAAILDRGGEQPLPFKPTFRDVRAAILRRSGEFLVAIPDQGLMVWRANEWVRIESPLRPQEQVYCFFEDGLDSLWIGTDHGLYRAHGDHFEDFSARLAPAEDAIGIVQSTPDQLFVATHAGVIRIDDGAKLTALRPHAPNAARTVGICRRADGSILVADAAGYILRVAGDALVSVTAGPITPNTALGPLIEDAHGQIWSTTPAGLMCLDWSSGEVRRRRIGRDGGLESSDLRVIGQPHFARTEDGRLWIAANQQGLLSLTPEAIANYPSSSRLVLEAITSDPRRPPRRRSDGGYDLPAGTDLVKLQVAAPDFAEPRLRRYEYRLSPDEDWIDVGDAQQILLHHLPPGDYNVEVRTFAANCGWPDGELVVRVWLAPHFWQHSGFAGFALLTVLALSMLAMRHHERRKSRVLAAKLEQHRTIAHERARFESLFEATSNLVGFLSPDGRVLRLNPSARNALRPVDDDGNTPFHDLFPESDRGLLADTILPAVAAHGSWQGRLSILGQSGNQLPIYLLIHAHRTVQGGTDYMSWIAHDLSERIRAAEERRSLELQLQRAQKAEALGTLAGGIAHDFNNVLTAILGYADLTRDRVDQASDVEHGLARITAAAQHARSLVARIMTFGRASPSPARPIAVEAVARDAVELVRATLSPNTTLRCDIAPCPPILCDPTELEQVLVNVLTNASHAIGDNPGTIHLVVAPSAIRTTLRCVHRDLEPGNYVRIEIRDDGCGIAPDLLERIFDPFFTTKPQGRGTGLGLSIVLGSVTNASGGILVESRLGQGSTFTLLFPATATQPEPLRTVRAPATDRSTQEGRRVLVVDDDPFALDACVVLLRSLGHRVTHHAMPDRALAMFEGAPREFDVVITDLRMPGISGIVLARRVLEIRPGIPVVIVTGYGDTVELDAVAAQRVIHVLRKPFTREELAARLATAIAGSASSA